MLLWNIYFFDSGKPHESIRFIDYLEIWTNCYQIDKNKLSKAMPEFLPGLVLVQIKSRRVGYLEKFHPIIYRGLRFSEA